LRSNFDIRIAYRSCRKALSILRFITMLARWRPAVSYVFDMSYSGVLAGALHRWAAGNHIVIETGDAIYELARSTGSRGRVGLWLTRCLEKFSFHVADRVVVRSHGYRDWLLGQGIPAAVIPDGVSTGQFTPLAVADLRRQYGLEGVLTVGLVGWSMWSDKLQMCYGWELVELIRLLKGAPVKGVLIGGGSGIPRLRALCREYGIEEQILFLGYIPFEQLPRHLNLLDVCLSTQTNNLVGQVRTTGKLPLYLATGRYVLASRVGEAAQVLEEDMLVPYEGLKDHLYPHKLASRIAVLLKHPERLRSSERNVSVAKTHFDYSVLAEKMAQVLKEGAAEEGGGGGKAA
jgi:glycosyltransferase involved in cell wall biosynthesis